MNAKWYKTKDDDQIWWKETDCVGEMVFSFDKIHEFNFWQDFDKLTEEQKAIFKRESPTLYELKE